MGQQGMGPLGKLVSLQASNPQTISMETFALSTELPVMDHTVTYGYGSCGQVYSFHKCNGWF